jgi:hypothetical protein
MLLCPMNGLNDESGVIGQIIFAVKISWQKIRKQDVCDKIV